MGDVRKKMGELEARPVGALFLPGGLHVEMP